MQIRVPHGRLVTASDRADALCGIRVHEFLGPAAIDLHVADKFKVGCESKAEKSRRRNISRDLVKVLGRARAALRIARELGCCVVRVISRLVMYQAEERRDPGAGEIYHMSILLWEHDLQGRRARPRRSARSDRRAAQSFNMD